ncbi:hypothetical protein BOX15_Mlig019155g2 [Macrostomum lignano]|nr:hypothetical protein BOX15_Mlig019155g2 [Macrostomum lignano]
MILPKMALEIRIDGNVVYSRLMRSGFHNFPNLTEFVANQINCALNSTPLHFIPADEYAKFMESFRRRDSDCVDQTDMRPNDEGMLSTGGNSVQDRTNTSYQTKGRRNYTTTGGTTVSH